MFNSDLERVAVHADFMCFDWLERGQLNSVAGGDIEPRTMSRTFDFLTLQLTLVE